jgi:hypothetical protein
LDFGNGFSDFELIGLWKFVNLLNQVPTNPAALLKSKLLSAQSKVSSSHL